MRREDRDKPKSDAVTKILGAVQALTAALAEENIDGSVVIQLPTEAWRRIYESRSGACALAIVSRDMPSQCWLQLRMCGRDVRIEPEGMHL